MLLGRDIAIYRKEISSVCIFYELPLTLGAHGIVGALGHARHLRGAVGDRIATSVGIHMNYRIQLLRLITVDMSFKYILGRCYVLANVTTHLGLARQLPFYMSDTKRHYTRRLRNDRKTDACTLR